MDEIEVEDTTVTARTSAFYSNSDGMMMEENDENNDNIPNNHDGDDDYDDGANDMNEGLLSDNNNNNSSSSLSLLEQRLNMLQKEINLLKQRNYEKDRGKDFEGSWTRVIFLMVVTYITLWLYMEFVVKSAKPPLDAVVPTVGFNISTWSLPYVKEWWIQLNYYRRYGQFEERPSSSSRKLNSSSSSSKKEKKKDPKPTRLHPNCLPEQITHLPEHIKQHKRFTERRHKIIEAASNVDDFVVVDTATTKKGQHTHVDGDENDDMMELGKAATPTGKNKKIKTTTTTTNTSTTPASTFSIEEK